MSTIESRPGRGESNIPNIEVVETGDNAILLKYFANSPEVSSNINYAIYEVFQESAVHQKGGDDPSIEMWEIYGGHLSKKGIEERLPKVYERARRNFGGTSAHAQ